MPRKRTVRLEHIAAVLIAACLSGCGYAMFDADPSASLSGSGNNAPNRPEWTRNAAAEAPEPPAAVPAAPSAPSNKPATNSLFTRAADAPPSPQTRTNDPIAALVAGKPVATAELVKPAEPPRPQVIDKPVAEKVAIEPHGRAYLFRGVAGLIYSRGMDRLNDRINRTGVTSTVNTYLLWRPVADEAIREYRRDPQPITLIGHSMGGDSAVAFAELLNSADIPVNLLVTYDPTRIADDVPPNVERYINIYQSLNIMGGGDVVQGRRFHGHYASFNLKDHSEIIHINIEKAEHIHDQLVTKVAQLSATPANAEGEAVPIRYVVPAGAPIELWDSGMPVFVHGGDTLQTLAETYHVPLWSVAQINRLPERGALSEGQRVVVPRHLVPMTSPANSAVSSYAPTSR